MDTHAGSRAAALEREELIDVDEWAQAHGRSSPLPLPAAITRELWQAIETLPFGLIGRVTFEQRLCKLLERAACALRRELTLFGSHPVLDLYVGFGAELPSRSDAPRWRSLTVCCGPDDHGSLVLTIGFPHEIKPLALAADER